MTVIPTLRAGAKRARVPRLLLVSLARGAAQN